MKISVALIICGCAALALTACKKQEKQQVMRPPAAVVLKAAESRDVNRFIETLGTTDSVESVSIIPQVSGQLVSLNFNQGDIVKRGQVLATIDKRPYEANVLAAKAAVALAKAQLSIDTLEVERNRKLAEQNYVDKQTFDSYLAKVEADKAQLAAAEAQLRLAEINLDWCDVKAPVDGKVGLFNLDKGNIVSANSPSSMITTLERMDELYVDFFVPGDRQFDVRKLMQQRGGNLDIEVSYIDKKLNSYTRKGRVSIMENRNRYQSATLVLRGVLDNKDGMFWPSQSVKVRLEMELCKDGILISSAAVMVDNAGKYVYVARPFGNALYTIQKLPVEIVQQFPNGDYLVGGLKSGDLVVERGQLLIAQGALAYAATPQGLPLDENFKPINPAEIKNFIGKAAKINAEYLAKAAAARASGASGQPQPPSAGALQEKKPAQAGSSQGKGESSQKGAK